MLFPLYALGNIIMGSSTNTSTPYPIVTTNAATNLASTTATLNGTGYNYNSTGTSFFNYGTTTAYGTRTTLVTFTANTITTAFSSNLTGLTAGTTYHFQACVSNSAGITCGSDLTFGTVGLGTMTILAGLTSPHAGNTASLAIDTINGFLYVCSGANPYIWKIRLSDFSNQGTLTLSGGAGDTCRSITIDSANTIMYAAISTNSLSGSNSIYSINLSSFTVIASQYHSTLDIGCRGVSGYEMMGIAVDNGNTLHVASRNFGVCNMTSALVLGTTYTIGAQSGAIGYDSINNHVFGTLKTGANTSNIGQFDTSLNLLNTYVSGLSSGDSFLNMPAFDYVNGYVYFPGGSDISTLMQVTLSGTFSGANIGTSISAHTVGVGSTIGYLYIGNASAPGTIKSRLLTSPSSDIGTLTLSAYVGQVAHIIVDNTTNIMYAGITTSPIKVVKVQLN